MILYGKWMDKQTMTWKLWYSPTKRQSFHMYILRLFVKISSTVIEKKVQWKLTDGLGWEWTDHPREMAGKIKELRAQQKEKVLFQDPTVMINSIYLVGLQFGSQVRIDVLEQEDGLLRHLLWTVEHHLGAQRVFMSGEHGNVQYITEIVHTVPILYCFVVVRFTCILQGQFTGTTSKDLVNTAPRNGLLPDGNKPLPEPMLTYHQWSTLAFIWEEFLNKFSTYQSRKCLKCSKITQSNIRTISSRYQWVKIYFDHIPCVTTLC